MKTFSGSGSVRSHVALKIANRRAVVNRESWIDAAPATNWRRCGAAVLIRSGHVYQGVRSFLASEQPMNLYVGTSGYSYKEWKGTFYPKDLPAPQMLRYYGERFRTVEINSTFYGMPKASVLEGWADAVPADFKFVLKAPQQITHRQRLKDTDNLVSHFLEVAGALRQRRGPLLFQLPPTAKKDLPRL